MNPTPTFHVYPDTPTDPQTGPLTVGHGLASDPPQTIPELFAPGTNTMFIRVVEVGSCTPPSGADPSVILQATDPNNPVPPGDETEVDVGSPTGATAIRNKPPGMGGLEVADATISAEGAKGVYLGVYLVKVDIISPGSTWKMRIKNNDSADHDYTWVVASTDAEASQPWLDLPPTLSFDVLTGQAVPLALRAANKGTGALTFSEAAGTPLGPGFVLTAVPAPIGPNACGDLQTTFTGPAAPGPSTATHTFVSNDPRALAGFSHNNQVTLSAKTAALEIMLLMDTSGSMAFKPDGTPAVSGTDARWAHARTAAKQFLDLLNMFGAGAGRIGVGMFPDITPATYPGTPAACPSSADFEAAADLTGPNVTAAKTALDKYTPVANAGATPMGHGIGRVIGTTAGSFGYFQGDAQSLQFNRRWMVLMSDGANNCNPPFPTDFYPPGAGPGESLADKHVSTITIGYGDPTVPTPFEVDWSTLMALAAAPPPGKFLSSGLPDNNGMSLLKSFRTAISAGLSLNPTADPGGVLSSGSPESRSQVGIGWFDRRVAFVVNWVTPNATRVEVELLSPNCELVTPSTPNTDPTVLYANEDRYAIYTLTENHLRNAADPGHPRYGTWTLIVRGTGLEGEDSELFEYEVIMDSRLKLDARFEDASYYAGDTIRIVGKLALDGQPVTGAAVAAELKVPGLWSHNVMAALPVTAAEMKQAAAHLPHDDVSSIGIKAFALASRGEVLDGFYDHPRIAMLDPDGVGAYEATYGSTSTPGIFTAAITATGQTSDGTPFRREARLQTHLDVRPEATFTLVDIAYAQIALEGAPVYQATVRAWPRDRYGNVYLVDPAIDRSVAVTAQAATLVGPLVGNLDGSYSQTLQYRPGALPRVGLEVAGHKVIAPQPVVPVEQLSYVNQLLDFDAGAEAEPGANQHAIPDAVLGDVTLKADTEYLSLGAYGSVVVGILGQSILARGPDDVTVFVRPDEELRPYTVEAQRTDPDGDWIVLGHSGGITQSFSLGAADLRAARAVRVVDRSGRTRGAGLAVSPSPGVSVRGVGVKKAGEAPGPAPGCLGLLIARILELIRDLLGGRMSRHAR